MLAAASPALAGCKDEPGPSVDWSECDKMRLMFNSVDLANGQFVQTFFSSTDLAGANLSGADLSLAELSNARLAGANLAGSLLEKAVVVGAHTGEPRLPCYEEIVEEPPPRAGIALHELEVVGREQHGPQHTHGIA